MYRYLLFKKAYRSVETNPYFSYGIKVSHFRVEDITTDRASAKYLADLLNAGQVNPKHLHSFIITFLDH